MDPLGFLRSQQMVFPTILVQIELVRYWFVTPSEFTMTLPNYVLHAFYDSSGRITEKSEGSEGFAAKEDFL